MPRPGVNAGVDPGLQEVGQMDRDCAGQTEDLDLYIHVQLLPGDT